MRNEFVGGILEVRAVEDAIRSSKKYTEGVFTKFAKHPNQIQGEDFPSRTLTKHYEVYPDMDMDEMKRTWDALLDFSDWLWGDTPHIDISFKYNYHRSRAIVIVHGGNGVVKMLEDNITGFKDALGKVTENGKSA